MEQLKKKNLRRCFMCKEVYELSSKNFNHNRRKGRPKQEFSYGCRDCERERNRMYRSKNKERLKEYFRKFNKHRRLKLRFMVLNRDDFTCQYCGRKAPEVELHIDHIKPKSRGGENKIENYRTSCLECNVGKADILLESP